MIAVRQIVINEGLLVLSALLGAAVGLLLLRWLRRSGDERDGSLKLFSDVMTYVSTIFGIMLGLMLLFTVQHFTTTASHVRAPSPSRKPSTYTAKTRTSSSFR